jgi:UDP-N-acetylglucosamine 2-epimerase (non-hydrolysing)
MTRSIAKILTVFGTRPEVIKLAPVIQELDSHADCMRTINVATSQHTDLLYPFIRHFKIRIDHDLRIMEPSQTAARVCARVLSRLEPILAQEKPDLVLVQGDTTTALAGALAGFYGQIPVGHVEAGLRSGNVKSPYPEEMNRRLITRLADYHFAATPRNCAVLLDEGVRQENIFMTGNPVVDALHSLLAHCNLKSEMRELLDSTNGLKRIVLTTHRRESFGRAMDANLHVLRRFVDSHSDVAVIFPVHPNPLVVKAADSLLSGHPRIYLIQPLCYEDFIALLSHAWLIISDSGGVQEEAPSLGKPLLVLRENTERPEAVESGVARLVGGRPERLSAMLDETYKDESWSLHVQRTENPFGRGDSGKRIVQSIASFMALPISTTPT